MTKSDKALYISCLKLTAIRAAQLVVLLVSIALFAFVIFGVFGMEEPR